MERVSPSVRLRRELEDALAGVGQQLDPIEVIGRLLGRVRYERCEEVFAHRNGCEPKTVKTTSGPMVLERPRVRNCGRGRLRQPGAGPDRDQDAGIGGAGHLGLFARPFCPRCGGDAG